MGVGVCVCVRACMRARARVRVCVSLSDFLETVGLSDDACRGSDVNVCRAEGRDDSVMCTVG